MSDQSPDPLAEVHKPFPDDGVTYCGWTTESGTYDGCGEVWPCATVRARMAGGRDLTPSETLNPLADVIRRALGEVLWNASNYPDRVQPYILGQNTAPLRDKATDAVMAALRVAGALGAAIDDLATAGNLDRASAAAIEARHNTWYSEGEGYGGPPASWPGRDPDESMEHYIVRNDVPALLAAVRASAGSP